jgi:hypothetical protein
VTRRTGDPSSRVSLFSSTSTTEETRRRLPVRCELARTASRRRLLPS